MNTFFTSIDVSPLVPEHRILLYAAISPSYNTSAGWFVHSCDDIEDLLDVMYEVHGHTGFYYTVSMEGSVIGFIGYRWREDGPGYGLVTYLIEEYRGIGINTVLKDLMLQVFSVTRQPLYAFIREDNVRSIKAMERVLQKCEEWMVEKKRRSNGYIMRKYRFSPGEVSYQWWSEEFVRSASDHLVNVIRENLIT